MRSKGIALVFVGISTVCHAMNPFKQIKILSGMKQKTQKGKNQSNDPNVINLADPSLVFDGNVPNFQITLKDYYNCATDSGPAEQSEYNKSAVPSASAPAAAPKTAPAAKKPGGKPNTLPAPQSPQPKPAANDSAKSKCTIFRPSSKEQNRDILSKCKTSLVNPGIFRIPDTIKGSHTIMLFSATRNYFPKFIVHKLDKATGKYVETEGTTNGMFDFREGESYCIEIGHRNFLKTENFMAAKKGDYYMLLSDTLKDWATLAQGVQFTADVKLKDGSTGKCSFKLGPEEELKITAGGTNANLGYLGSSFTVMYDKEKKAFKFYFARGTFKAGANKQASAIVTVSLGDGNAPGTGKQLDTHKYEIECRSNVFKPLIDKIEENEAK